MPEKPIIKLCQDQAMQRIDSVQEQIESKLVGAEDGKLTVTIRLKLSLVKGRAYCNSAITIPQDKIIDEGEDSAELDVDQIKLGLS